MHIVCNDCNLDNKALVSNLTSSSMKISMIPNDDFSAILTFSGKDFNSLLLLSDVNESVINKLTRITHFNNTLSRMYHAVNNLFVQSQKSTDKCYDMLDTLLWMMRDGNKKVIEDEVDSLINGKHGITPLINFLKELNVNLNELMNKSRFRENTNIFSFGDDHILINESMSISGQTLTKLKAEIKEYTDKYASKIIDSYYDKNEEKISKYQSFLLELSGLEFEKVNNYEDFYSGDINHDQLCVFLEKMIDLFYLPSLMD